MNGRTGKKVEVKIFSHESSEYPKDTKENGALLYSEEILKYFIPNIKTTRNWVTIRKVPYCFDHSIVFIHNNLHPEFYEYLSNYKDLVLVCGVPETCEKVKQYGKTIYLPLSIPVDEIKQYRTWKTKDVCYAGRKGKFAECNVLQSIPKVEDLPREEFLKEMAKYRKVYAVGRTALEAKVLGCKILAYDPRFPNPKVWEVFDTKDAIKLLQAQLDEIDK